MTTIDSYRTQMIAPDRFDPEFPFGPEVFITESPKDRLMRSTYDLAMKDMEVTEQEEEAWLEKMQRLAGCVA